MVRKLKHHEEKLLKKVDFFQWKSENSKEQTVIRRFHLHNREDYIKYNKLCGYITKIASLISLLQPDDPFRGKVSVRLLDKLYDSGIISHKNTLSQLSRVSTASFCKRRLASVLVGLKMCQHFEEATNFVRQGHIRVGPDVITDPSYFVTRGMEDFVTWVDQSKIKRKIASYNNTVDDYDLMN